MADTLFTRKEVEQLAARCKNPQVSFLLLALFEGLGNTELHDIADVRMKDFRDGKVHLASGRAFEVTDTLVKYASLANEAEGVSRWQREEDAREGRILKLAVHEGSPQEIKKRKRNIMYGMLRRAMAEFGYPNVSPFDLVSSGRLDYINRHSDVGGIQDWPRSDKVEPRKTYAIKYGGFRKDRLRGKYDEHLE